MAQRNFPSVNFSFFALKSLSPPPPPPVVSHSNTPLQSAPERNAGLRRRQTDAGATGDAGPKKRRAKRRGTDTTGHWIGLAGLRAGGAA